MAARSGERVVPQLWRVKKPSGGCKPRLVRTANEAELSIFSEEEYCSLKAFNQNEDDCWKSLEQAKEFLAESAESTIAAITDLQPKRLSIAPNAMVVPITPHTNKKRKPRTRKRSSNRNSIIPMRSMTEQDSDDISENKENTRVKIVIPDIGETANTPNTSNRIRDSLAAPEPEKAKEKISESAKSKRSKRSSTRKKPVKSSTSKRVTRSSRNAQKSIVLDNIQEDVIMEAGEPGEACEVEESVTSMSEQNDGENLNNFDNSSRNKKTAVAKVVISDVGEPSNASNTDRIRDSLEAPEPEKVEEEISESAKPRQPKRSSTRKKPVKSSGSKKGTRSSKNAQASIVLPNIQEDIVMEVGEPEKVCEVEKNVTSTPVGNGPGMSLDSQPTKTPESKELSSSQSGDESQSPVEVRQLIAFHEAIIEKQHVDKPVETPKTTTGEQLESASIPTEHMTPVKDQRTGTCKRSVEEQIASCLKKNPIVNINRFDGFKCQLSMDVDSPGIPITLSLDPSDDDEDITDKVEKSNLDGVSNSEMASEDVITTPTGTAPPNRVLPPRRSLIQELYVSRSESDEDIITSNFPAIKNQTLDSDNDDARLALEIDDSLDGSKDNPDPGTASADSSARTSQTSSSVCSSTAATVILDGESEVILENLNPSASSESEDDDPGCSPPKMRRSSRKRKSVTCGLAAKRLSSAAKLSAKKRTAKIRIANKVAEAKDSEDDIPGSSKRTPKIVKPVIRIPKVTTVKGGAERKTTKRNIDQVASGFQSPLQPRKGNQEGLLLYTASPPKKLHDQFMRCGSPLCQEKSKKKISPHKKGRNTFLNRSTAASRARQTPGFTSPAVGTRTRAALFAGSPYKFSAQNLATPVCTNLTVDIQSFIKRITPQKVNIQDQMAAKQEQLKDKQKREREIKKRKEEEREKRRLEKKRKMIEKQKKATKLREQREKEEKEKKEKMVEQWEKKVADADKVKVLRKKEETVKVKIMKRKQLEAEENRRKEEEERLKKLKELEQEREKRLQEQKLQKEREAAAKKLAEQEKLELRRQEKLRHEKEEEEKRLKMKEEIDRRNAEAAKLEQERIEKEKEMQRKLKEEAQRRQEEAIRRKEKEEARRKKVEEARAAAEEKARKRKQEEIAKAEELRKKREAIRKEAERQREMEKEAEKRRLEEERRKKAEEERQEKLRKIQESNDKLRKLEAEHKKEKAAMKEMGLITPAMEKSLCQTPGMNTTYTLEPHGTSSYDMTPQVIKQFAPSTEEDYNINDLSSGDSTDDDEAPRKEVPLWAKGAKLRAALVKQYYSTPDLDDVFDNVDGADAMNLQEIFKRNKTRYFHRTSSAQWNSPVRPPGHISFTEYCRGFN